MIACLGVVMIIKYILYIKFYPYSIVNNNIMIARFYDFPCGFYILNFSLIHRIRLQQILASILFNKLFINNFNLELMSCENLIKEGKINRRKIQRSTETRGFDTCINTNY